MKIDKKSSTLLCLVLFAALLLCTITAQDHHHGHDHEENPLEALTTLIKGYIPNQKNISAQVYTSIAIISFPSIPIFIGLLLFGKITGSKTASGVPMSFLNRLISFAIGSLMGDTFFHIIPGLLDSHSSKHQAPPSFEHPPIAHTHSHSLGSMRVWILILLGVLGFYFADRVSQVLSYKRHVRSKGASAKNTVKGKGGKSVIQEEEEEEGHDHYHVSKSSFIFLFADFCHNFIDGIAIATSYNISFGAGISTTIAILFHELPHELGDFGILLKKNYTLAGVLLSQIMTSIGAFLGGLFCSFLCLSFNKFI